MLHFKKNGCVPELAALDASMVLSRKWAQNTSHQTNLRLIRQPPVDEKEIFHISDNCQIKGQSNRCVHSGLNFEVQR